MAPGNANYAKKLVKVHANTMREDTCKSCHEPVRWFRTATRQRWVLFDRETRVGKTRTDDKGTNFLYLDHGGVHWNHCKPLNAA